MKRSIILALGLCLLVVPFAVGQYPSPGEQRGVSLFGQRLDELRDSLQGRTPKRPTTFPSAGDKIQGRYSIPSSRSAERSASPAPQIAEPQVAEPPVTRPQPQQSTQARPATTAAKSPAAAPRSTTTKAFDPYADLNDEQIATLARRESIMTRGTPTASPSASKPTPIEQDEEEPELFDRAEPRRAATPEPEETPEPAVAPQRALPRELISTPGASVSTSRGSVQSTVRRSASISVETAGPQRIAIGKEATFRVTAKNSGDAAAEQLTVFVALPAWAEVVEARALRGNAGLVAEPGNEGIEWTLPVLEGQSSSELQLTLIPRKSQAFELAVQWSCAPTAAQAMVEVEEPKLELAVTGPSEVIFGQQQVYKLTLTNPGNGDADNVQIFLLPLNPGEETASQTIGKLAAGGSKSLEIELTARQAGELTLIAEATADGDLKAAAQQSVRVRRGEVKLEVLGPRQLYAGIPSTYEIHVRNVGDATARKVNIEALLPSGAEVVSASQVGQKKSERGEVQWLLEQLPAGGEQVLQIKCLLKQGGNNRFLINGQAEGESRDSAELITQVIALPDLALDVIDAPGPAPIGQPSIYEIHIRNRGSAPAEQLEIVAYFSEGIEPTACEGAPHTMSPGAVTIKLAKPLAAGSETVVKVRAQAQVPGQHKIRVELNCPSLGAKLVREDTTLYFDDGNTSRAAGANAAPSPAPSPYRQ